MDEDAHFCKFIDEVIDSDCLISLELFGGYWVKSLIRPAVEPVNCAAIDDWRELPAAIAQLLTDGRKS